MKKVHHLLVLISIIFVACNPKDNISPRLLPLSESFVGVNGPLIFQLIGQFQQASIEQNIKIEPTNKLRFVWDNNKVLIFPLIAFENAKQYQLTMQENLIADNGQSAIPNYEWKFNTHNLCISFLGNATSLPEIWKICSDNNTQIQLTKTGGKVMDFEVSYDGNWIIFAVRNERLGIDIWKMNREGEDAQKIIDCGEDECSNFALSIDSQRLVYVRSLKTGNQSSLKTGQQIYIKELNGSEDYLIFSDQKMMVNHLEWSPDGKSLLIYDEYSKSIWIWNEKDNSIIKIPTGGDTNASWTKLGDKLIYGVLFQEEVIPYVEVFQWDENTRTSSHLFGTDQDQIEYDSPRENPQKDWIACAVRPIQGSASEQIILFSANDNNQIQVTDNQIYTHSFFSWNPDGSEIVFQRFELGNSKAKPEIGVWEMDNQSITIIARDAAQPEWIP